MSFKLAPKNRWYVNKNGDKCEVALLNGAWVAVWDIDGVPLVTTHKANGETTALVASCWNITARFEGWLSNPFEGAPEWVKYATCNPIGELELWAGCPSIDGQYWHDFNEEAETLMGYAEYQGDWRNSLTHRGIGSDQPITRER